MDLNGLRVLASKCDSCNLCAGRKNPVFAKGNPASTIMICGMCPGYDENEIGIPFVGKAGQLLDYILSEAGIDIQNDVYITNLVKCFVRPGIKLEEIWMDSCLPYFQLQLALVKPKVIIGLGKDVCNYILGINTSIGSMREQDFYFDDSKFICTYHPSYLIRGGGIKHRDFDKVVGDFRYAFNNVGGNRWENNLP